MNIEGHILTSLFVDIPNKLSGVDKTSQTVRDVEIEVNTVH